jgi:hypothetical protein
LLVRKIEVQAGVVEAGQRLGSFLPSVHDAAQATLDTLTKLSLEMVEVKFGLKLAGRLER